MLRLNRCNSNQTSRAGNLNANSCAILVVLTLVLCLGAMTPAAQAADDAELQDSVLIHFGNDAVIECNQPDGLNQCIGLDLKVDHELSGVEFVLEIVSLDGASISVDDFYHFTGGMPGDWLPNIQVQTVSDGMLPDTVILRRYALSPDEYLPDFDTSGYDYPWTASRINVSCQSLGQIEVRNLNGQTKLWGAGVDPLGNDYYFPACPPKVFDVIDIESPILDDPGTPDVVVLETTDMAMWESTPVPIKVYNDEALDMIRIKLFAEIEPVPALVQLDSVVYGCGSSLGDRFVSFRGDEDGDFGDTLLIYMKGTPLPADFNGTLATAYFTAYETGTMTLRSINESHPKFSPVGSEYNEYFVPALDEVILTAILPLSCGGGTGIGDEGQPDRIYITPTEISVGESMPVTVNLFNDEPIKWLSLYLDIESYNNGNVRFDSLRWMGRLMAPALVSKQGYGAILADGVLPDSIVAYAYDTHGFELAAGDGPVAELYLTGLATGDVIVGPYQRFGVGSSLRANCGDRIEPTVVPGLIGVGSSISLPPVINTIVVDPGVSVVGDAISFAVTGYSPGGNPIDLSLVSFETPDFPHLAPVAMVDFSGGDFYWNPDANDVGVWEAVFEATDLQTGLSTTETATVQVVSATGFIVDYLKSSTYGTQHATAMTHGDFDGDFRPEIVMSSTYWGTDKVLGVYDLYSNTSLQEVFAIEDMSSNLGIATGYFNDDAYLDAVSCVSSNLWVFHGNGDNTFTVYDNTAAKPDGNVQGAVMADFNGDAYLDYVVATTTGVTVYAGSADGGFTQSLTFAAGGAPMSVNSADFNDDGLDDLAIGTYEGIEIYMNLLGANYVLANSYSVPFSMPDIEVTGAGTDFNGDGLFDLCIASPVIGGEMSRLRVYLGYGDGSFNQQVVRTFRGIVSKTSPADVNNDGLLDIAFINESEEYVGVVFGNGLGQFTDEMRMDMSGYEPCQIDCMDIDIDGDIDIVVSAIQTVLGAPVSSLHLFRNSLNPMDQSTGLLQVAVRNNADIEIVAPNEARLSAVSNGIVSGSIYRRNLDGDSHLDATATVPSVGSGRYDLIVGNLQSGEESALFSLEYSLGSERYVIARDQSTSGSGYTFPIFPEGNSPISPVQGAATVEYRPEFTWDDGIVNILPIPDPPAYRNSDNVLEDRTLADTDTHQSSLPMADEATGEFRISDKLTFETVLETAFVAGNSYRLVNELTGEDTTIYYWQVRAVGSDDWGPVFALQYVDVPHPHEEQQLVDDESLTFRLSENYPNPFNPTTDIPFALPTATHVKLEVFNILGQRVATVIDAQLPAGRHSGSWDASAQASGVYLYRLEAGEFTETKKMLLLK